MRSRQEERTPKYWWSHSRSLRRKETQCLQCEENSICDLTSLLKTRLDCALVFHLHANSTSVFGWSNPHVTAPPPQEQSADLPSFFQIYISASRLRKAESVKRKRSCRRLGENAERGVFLDFFNFFLYVRQSRGWSSSHPLLGEETEAVRAVSEFRSFACFCFYFCQACHKAQRAHNWSYQVYSNRSK